jgi:hypothetical protein
MARKIESLKASTDNARIRLARSLRGRFALRMHTSILLLWTFCAGLLTTKALFALGMQAMWMRYLIAIVVAYGAFLLGVRIWLAYIGRGHQTQSAKRLQAEKKKGGSIDLPDFSSSGGGSGGSGSGGIFRGGGGGGGGGGASGGFAVDAGAAQHLNLAAADGLSTGNVIETASSGGSSGIFSDVGGSVSDAVGGLGGDDGCLIAFAVMVVIGLIALAIGSAVFIIGAGPEILIDAAFNVMLAGGLVKATNRVNEPDWVGSVVKATWIPFAIVLTMALAFAITAAVLLPQAKTFGQVMDVLWPLLLSQF